MKKLFLLATLLIGFSTASYAQGLHFGIKGGLNFADLNGGDINVDSRTSFHIGAVLEARLSDNFAIQPEAIYSSQGAKLGSDDLKLDYINIPVMADIKLIKSLSLHVGPQFGFNISEDNINDPKTFDLGGAAGLELKILKFFAQARYNFGLTDVAEGAGSPKNAVFQLSVGFNFF